MLDHAITIGDVLILIGGTVGIIILVLSLFWLKNYREYRDAIRSMRENDSEKG